VFSLRYKDVNKKWNKMSKNHFYKCRQELVDYGLLDEIEQIEVEIPDWKETMIARGFERKQVNGLAHKKKLFRKSDRWKEVDARLELADLKTLHSLKMKELGEQKQAEKEIYKVLGIEDEKKEKAKIVKMKPKVKPKPKKKQVRKKAKRTAGYYVKKHKWDELPVE